MAVVGSFTAGESALFAHVDHDAYRQRGVLLERALIAERNHSLELLCRTIPELAPEDMHQHFIGRFTARIH